MKTLLNGLLIVIFCIQHIQAQITLIPDPNFEQELISRGIDSDNLVNGQMATSDALGVEKLDVSTWLSISPIIQSLKGIEAFVDLDTLICYNNLLDTLDLSNNLSLKYVNCWRNELNYLNVSNNSNLDALYCGGNQLDTIDVTSNLVLTNLNVEDNNLTTIDVSNNTALFYFRCGDNQLTSIDVSNHIQLNYLHCGNNLITALDVTNNLNLQYFDCAANQLTALDVTNNPLLYNIRCNENNIQSLDVSNCLGLTNLNISNNQFTTLDLQNNPQIYLLVCHFNQLTYLDLSDKLDLNQFYCSGNQLTKLILPHTSLSHMHAYNNQAMYLQICVPDASNIPTSGWIKDPSAFYTQGCFPLSVIGRVAIDSNSNCLVDSLENGLNGHLQFERLSDGMIYHATTYDSSGNYVLGLDTGTYVVSMSPVSLYWTTCLSSQLVTIDTNYIVQTIDWALEPQIYCPLMEVDISSPFLRATGGGSAYTVSYCNSGTVPATNVYVEVDLDPDLNYLGASIPLVSQTGTVYTFNLDTVAVGACGKFEIQVVVDTSAQIFQTHCTEVHIFPDSICVPIWSDAIVDGNVTCQNDTVFFQITNIGAAMLQPQPYTVIEDDIAMRIGTVLLGAGQTTTIAQAALPQKTYRIMVNQMPGIPGLIADSVFSIAIEGCNPATNGAFNTGFITQFSNGHSTPFQAIDCQESIGSYDPNDKSAQPVGYGSQHRIFKNTDIDYKIRFQNTGTDTAFNIAIMDTISPHLDITTLKMGASSHTYNWNIVDNNILIMSFSDIKLVDSNANEPLSHGFIRYRIEQKANNPIGTLIENSASIYFDYNLPIKTNTTFHTIDENFITVSVDKIYVEKIKVTAFPNPFTNFTTIKVEGKEYEELELLVFDVTGRSVAQKQNSFSNQIELPRQNLQTGVYFYQLLGDGVLLNSGKIIAQ